MKIHTKIRDEVLTLLQDKVPDIDHYYNGRPPFIDLDQQASSLAVFLDEATCNEVTVCNEQWEAELIIAIYIKSIDNGEDELDELAQMVADAIQIQSDEGFEHITNISLSQYRYEQDQQKTTWYIANLIYTIQYDRQGA